MRYRAFLIFLMIFTCLELSAQKLRTVSGSYTYFDVPKTMSMEEAENIALQRCKNQILAKEFGTFVGVANFTRIENKSGDSAVDMLSLSASEVKGDWVETVGEPVFRHSVEEGKLTVTVTVTGKVREIKSSSVDFDARLLRNGCDDRFESCEFKDGDFMFLAFRSPVDGYVAVYLCDAENNAYCLLPYYEQTNGQVSVKANREYVYFSKKHVYEGLPAGIVDEYQLTCSAPSMELNRIYVIFSPSSFFKAVDGGADSSLPRTLDFETFQKWLLKCRRQDERMAVKVIDVKIRRQGAD